MSERAADRPDRGQGLSTRARLGIAVLALAVLVGAFLVLRGGSSDDDAGGPASAPARTATDGQGSSGSASAPAAQPAPVVPVVRIRGGKPVAGVRRITVHKGERIRFSVVSDAPGEVHLHGYDVERELTPGRPARFNLRATIEGRFEVELHGTDTQVARLDVTP